MGLIEAWLNTAVREGFADGRPLADVRRRQACRRAKCFAAKWS